MTDIQRLELQRKLNWLHKHQPNNWQAIQALETQLRRPKIKMYISKEWLLSRAPMEEGLEIGAGRF